MLIIFSEQLIRLHIEMCNSRHENEISCDGSICVIAPSTLEIKGLQLAPGQSRPGKLCTHWLLSMEANCIWEIVNTQVLISQDRMESLDSENPAIVFLNCWSSHSNGMLCCGEHGSARTYDEFWHVALRYYPLLSLSHQYYKNME